MSVLGVVARMASGGASTLLTLLWGIFGPCCRAGWTALAPVFSSLTACLTAVVSSVSCAVFGAAIGTALGLTAVNQWRRYVARRERFAARQEETKEAHDGFGAHGASGYHSGVPPPRPVPPDIVALALLHLPKWAKEPEVNRMAWFNKTVDYMWPHVDTAVCETVRDSVEPIMRRSVPPIVSWIGFEKITLGPTPPTLGGVKVHGSNSDEAMIEIEFSWAGGLDVVVAAYVFGVRLPFRMHDLQYRTYVRVTFSPLVDELPCLGALQVSLMGPPEHLDFGVTVPPGIDLMALPGAQQVVRLGIWKVLGPKMMYPAKLHVPIMANSGVEPQSTGMIKVTVLAGQQMSSRRDVKRGGNQTPTKKSRKGFLGSLFKGERYFVQMFTRASRKVMLKEKSSDEPTWNEMHYFLTNPDSFLTAVLYSSNMKELGRCELPLSQLTTEDRAGKPTRLLLHIDDEAPFVKKPPERRKPPEGRDATDEEWEEIMDEHAEMIQSHAVDLAKARAKCLAISKLSSPSPGLPVIYCDMEYVAFSDRMDDGGKGEKRGILTVFLDRAIHIKETSSKSIPKPAATVSCAEQTYTAKVTEKTNKPHWDETFLFFNVSTTEKVRVSLNDQDATGEFLGEFHVDVSRVAKNLEIQDVFAVTGVKTNAQVFARLKFSYMS